jgi:hypothetical protein
VAGHKNQASNKHNADCPHFTGYNRQVHLFVQVSRASINIQSTLNSSHNIPLYEEICTQERVLKFIEVQMENGYSNRLLVLYRECSTVSFLTNASTCQHEDDCDDTYDHSED